MKRKIRILALDGGGVRGLLPGVLLKNLEERLQTREGSDRRLSDYFELIAGTSAGGILTCGYLVPEKSGRPKYSAREVLDLFLQHGSEIFPQPLPEVAPRSGRLLTRLRGIFRARYEEGPLENVLGEFFGDCMLSDLLKPCLLTSYDITGRRAVFFNSLDGDTPSRNFAIKDVARATSAAPTYFAVPRIRSELGALYPMIDGGVFANNPSMCAYAEARSLDFSRALQDREFPSYPSAKDMMILSIGTGLGAKSYPYEEAKDWGAIGWMRPLLDILTSAASENVDYQLRQMFGTLNPLDATDYMRINPDLRDASVELDETSPKNIRALHDAGLHYIAEHERDLERVVDKLINLGVSGGEAAPG